VVVLVKHSNWELITGEIRFRYYFINFRNEILKVCNKNAHILLKLKRQYNDDMHGIIIRTFNAIEIYVICYAL
jgi:hypothetical protein